LKSKTPTPGRERKFRVLVVAASTNGGEASTSVDGAWKLRTQTPTGMRKSELVLVADGSTLTGEQSADGRSGPIADGTVSGNTVAWKISIVDPLRLTLQYNGTVRGNAMRGNMKAGRFGAWPFVGRRQ
jgi:hypothetical protein